MGGASEDHDAGEMLIVSNPSRASIHTKKGAVSHAVSQHHFRVGYKSIPDREEDRLGVITRIVSNPSRASMHTNMGAASDALSCVYIGPPCNK